MLSEQDQERIDNYLLGTATPAEAAALEAEAAANPELARELAATRAALDAIELGEDAALKERLRGLEAGATVRRLHPRRRYWAAAAAVLLLLAAGWFVFRPAPEPGAGELFALAEFEPYPNIAYRITKGAADSTARAAAFAAYERADWAAAAAAFATLEDEPVNRFYLGQSQLAAGNYAAAAATLEPLPARTDFNLADEAAYYRAVALLGTGDQPGATALLEPLAGGPASAVAAEARELLEKLR